MLKRVENRAYVIWIGRLNPVRNVGIVSGRFCGRYVVSDLGFCDFDSADFFRRTTIFIFFAIVTQLVPIGCSAWMLQDTDANLAIPSWVTTEPCQRTVEGFLILPLNVYRSSRRFTRTSNIHGIRHDVWEEWKIAAADDHKRRDYRYDDERDESRWGFHKRTLV